MTEFKKTPKQIEAVNLIGSGARNIMLFGGSRSGKTFINIYAIVVRAAKEKNSRHLILRLNFNHAKRSIWLDTLVKVMNLCFPKLSYVPNNQDLYLKFPNGSEIWVGGLDNKERSEKILGNEYSTVYFNECSQLDYKSISMALTRLAQKNALRKIALYDENPPSKKHWSYWRFIRHVDPDSGEELNKDKWASMLMNPRDNIDNIDEDYIDEVLKDLPEKEKRRFLYGEFVDAEEGLIYYSFNREKHCQEVVQRPRHPIYIGVDFNVNPMTATVGQLYDGKLYILDEFFLKNSNTPDLCRKIIEKFGPGHTIVPDSTGNKTTTNANRSDLDIIKQHGFKLKVATNPFRIDRYAAVNAAIGKGLVVFSPKCKYTIKDLETLSYKDGTDKPDVTDPMAGHISDALGYLIYRTINPLRGPISQISSQPR